MYAARILATGLLDGNKARARGGSSSQVMNLLSMSYEGKEEGSSEMVVRFS
jgi:hypothetical protein